MPLPPVGTRVMIRYRLPAGSEPPLNDVVGHLLAAGATLQVRTKQGEVVDVDAEDIVVLRELPPAPVRTADIRNLEHAAALGWPGLQQHWVDGWLLRAADGHTHRGNSAVPLGFDADASALPAIVDWYAERGLTPWLSLPDRLFRLFDAEPHLETVVMSSDLKAPVQPAAHVALTAEPDDEWLRVYQRDIPREVLTAVIDGEVMFGSIPGVAVGRAAVTASPDGTRWVGLSAVRVDESQRRRGHARELCTTLLTWGTERGATRAYLQVLTDNVTATTLFESIGFRVQHRSRYVSAETLQKGGGW
jgi:N-acetylglutamate synthase